MKYTIYADFDGNKYKGKSYKKHRQAKKEIKKLMQAQNGIKVFFKGIKLDSHFVDKLKFYIVN